MSGSAHMATLTPAEIDNLAGNAVLPVCDALREETAALKKFIAAEDADAVHKATHGLGTDEMRLVCEISAVSFGATAFAMLLSLIVSDCASSLLHVLLLNRLRSSASAPR